MFGKENGASVMEIDGKKRFLPDSGDVRMEFEWVGYRDFYEDPVMVKGNKGEGMSRWGLSSMGMVKVMGNSVDEPLVSMDLGDEKMMVD
ncbi:hypothetical protein V6N13_047003 [Hibiscus sabdariffa]